jgi:hypothetical protein
LIAYFDNGKNLQIDVAQKAGSSSIVVYIVQCFNSYNNDLSPRQNHKELRKAGKLTPKIYKESHTGKIDSKIVIIRDPIERLYSVYNDRVVLRNMNGSNDTIKSWEDFVYNLKDYRKQFADVAQHSRKQVEYFYEKDIDSYDKVYKTADITKHVKKHIGRVAEVKLKATHRKNRQTNQIEYNKDVEIVKIIQEHYADDYKYFKNHL